MDPCQREGTGSPAESPQQPDLRWGREEDILTAPETDQGILERGVRVVENLSDYFESDKQKKSGV